MAIAKTKKHDDIGKNMYLAIFARREFLREILYKNIAIIAIQHSTMIWVEKYVLKGFWDRWLWIRY